MSMMNDLTAVLGDLERLEKTATQGEWRYSYAHVTAFREDGTEEHVCDFSSTQNKGQATGMLITAMKSALPLFRVAVQELEAAKKELQLLRMALDSALEPTSTAKNAAAEVQSILRAARRELR